MKRLSICALMVVFSMVGMAKADSLSYERAKNKATEFARRDCNRTPCYYAFVQRCKRFSPRRFNCRVKKSENLYSRETFCFYPVGVKLWRGRAIAFRINSYCA